MADQDTVNNQTRAPLWMRITLVVSLAINLLIVGLVVGFVLSGGPERRDAPSGRELSSLYTRALDGEDRRALRRAFVRELSKDRPERGEVLTEFRSVVVVLRAEPFDIDALSEAMTLQAQRGADRQVHGQRLLVAQIAGMSAEERAAYADRLEAGLADLGKRRFKPERPPRD